MNFVAIAELMMKVIPFAFKAMQTVQADTGKPWEQVAEDVINHLTPGAPDAPALSAGAKAS